MSTKLSKDQTTNPWNDILSFKGEDEELEHEKQMLMYAFLSEIEKFQNIQAINRKTLAGLIKTSSSFITQIFRGNKPLNFETLAKIQKALNIKFYIQARPVGTEMHIDEHIFRDIKNSVRVKRELEPFWAIPELKNQNLYENSSLPH